MNIKLPITFIFILLFSFKGFSQEEEKPRKKIKLDKNYSEKALKYITFYGNEILFSLSDFQKEIKRNIRSNNDAYSYFKENKLMMSCIEDKLNSINYLNDLHGCKDTAGVNIGVTDLIKTTVHSLLKKGKANIKDGEGQYVKTICFAKVIKQDMVVKEKFYLNDKVFFEQQLLFIDDWKFW